MRTPLTYLPLTCALLTVGCGDDSTGPSDDGGESAGTTTGTMPTTSTSGMPTGDGSGDSGEESGSGSTSDDGTSSGSSGSESSSESGSSTGNGVCDVDTAPSDDPCVIDDAFGVFVSLEGDDTAAGTMDDPFRTIEHALSEVDVPGIVFLCGQDFGEENVTIPAGVNVYGGLDCSDGWAWTGTRASFTGGEIGARVVGTGSTRIDDIDITAVDATGISGSSIGLLVVDAEIAIRRADITAGDGANGVSSPSIGGTETDGPDGDDGEAQYCSGTLEPTNGAEVSNPDCSASVGGAGGQRRDDVRRAGGQWRRRAAGGPGWGRRCGGLLRPGHGGRSRGRRHERRRGHGQRDPDRRRLRRCGRGRR